jgi:very-short-patch-repair endonuclease
VFDDDGCFVGRIDMGHPEWRVGIEYDGEQHWTDPVQRTRDIDRQTELEALDWRIIRVSAGMLRFRQATIVARTLAALRDAGRRI